MADLTNYTDEPPTEKTQDLRSSEKSPIHVPLAIVPPVPQAQKVSSSPARQSSENKVLIDAGPKSQSSDHNTQNSPVKEQTPCSKDNPPQAEKRSFQDVMDETQPMGRSRTPTRTSDKGNRAIGSKLTSQTKPAQTSPAPIKSDNASPYQVIPLQVIEQASKNATTQNHSGRASGSSDGRRKLQLMCGGIKSPKQVPPERELKQKQSSPIKPLERVKSLQSPAPPLKNFQEAAKIAKVAVAPGKVMTQSQPLPARKTSSSQNVAKALGPISSSPAAKRLSDIVKKVAERQQPVQATASKVASSARIKDYGEVIKRKSGDKKSHSTSTLTKSEDIESLSLQEYENTVASFGRKPLSNLDLDPDAGTGSLISKAATKSASHSGISRIINVLNPSRLRGALQRKHNKEVRSYNEGGTVPNIAEDIMNKVKLSVTQKQSSLSSNVRPVVTRTAVSQFSQQTPVQNQEAPLDKMRRWFGAKNA